MKKILYYNSTLLKGGTDVYMLNVIKNIDKNTFHVDVLIKDGDRFDKKMYDDLIEMGSNVFFAKGSLIKRMKQLKKYLSKNRGVYEVIHINATSGATGLIAYFAKKYGKIKKVIFHSHMGGNDNGKSFIDSIGIKLMKKNTDVLAACSLVASEYMFGNETTKSSVKILNNSVDYNFFKYNQDNRIKLRKQYEIGEDDLVILHVGRFVEQKNHKKLVDIFNRLKDYSKNAKLFLIGEGFLEDSIKNQVKDLNLENSVLFLGIKNNINEFMSMADCFVMPSIHEGLPIVAVEAQAADLPLVLSENISKETKLTNKVEFVSLEDSLDLWVEKILKLTKLKRKSNHQLFKEKGFDQESAIKIIENIYND